LRRQECCQLRVHDLDLRRYQLTVRHGKGGKDRVVRCRARCCRTCNSTWPNAKNSTTATGPGDEPLRHCRSLWPASSDGQLRNSTGNSCLTRSAARAIPRRATSGIGLGIARGLAQAGARVAIIARNTDNRQHERGPARSARRGPASPSSGTPANSRRLTTETQVRAVRAPAVFPGCGGRKSGTTGHPPGAAYANVRGEKQLFLPTYGGRPP
jgi:hypothetical protein